jgi:hypothetical protein
MRLRFSWATLIPAACVLAAQPAVAQLGPPPGSPDRGVLTENECFLVMPPELIAAPTVTNVTPSGSGRYMLVQRMSIRITSKMLAQLDSTRPQQPPGESSLVLWDSQTRQSREVWRTPTSDTQIVNVSWMPESDTALILMRQMLPKDPKDPRQGMVTRNGLLRLTPAMEKAQVVGLTEVGEEGMLDLWVSPVKPIAVLHRTRWDSVKIPQPDGSVKDGPRNPDTLYLLSESGRIGAHVNVPSDQPLGGLLTGEDGGPVVSTYQMRADKKGFQAQFFALNPRTAALTPLEKAPVFRGVTVAAADAQNYPVRVRRAQAVAKDGDDQQKVGLLWLESTTKSEQPRTLIAADAANATLLPANDVVVYHAQGAVWATPLLRLDKAQFIAMRDAARRTTVLSNGKQLGLAVMMYAQDYDETYPTGDNINAKLTPYLKNDALFQGFTYTFGGGAMSSVEKPAETELGFVTGPGGRAVIYADGHVKWRPDQP